MRMPTSGIARRLPIVLVVAVFLASPAAGTYWKANVRTGSDIVMKDHRWPMKDRGTYYAFWLMGFAPSHPRLGSMYGGMHPNAPGQPPGMFMSYWGEVKNVCEGELFYPHGYGAEGASGGAHGEAVFIRPGAWYRMVKRIFPAGSGAEDRSWVGWWAKDVERNHWYLHSVVELPAAATGFSVGSSGFVEALGPPTEPRAFERRLGYCRKDGKWYKADTVSSSGWKFFKLIEDGTVLRYDRMEKDDPSVRTVKEFTTKQPDEPPLDPPAVKNVRAVSLGNQVAVSWEAPVSASPQLGYQLEAFDNPEAKGEPVAVVEALVPYIRVRRFATPQAARSVRVTVRDIFDQEAAVVVPVSPEEATPAVEDVGKTQPGLTYSYYEAAGGVDWTELPNFDDLAPARQGDVATIDDTVREARDRLYAFRYTGYVQAPADGLYVFTLATCDGNRLLIDGEVVGEHDGLHGRAPRQYAVALGKGLHAFELQYFYGAGRGHHGNLADILQVSWEGPGFETRRMGPGDFRCKPAGQPPAVTLSLEGRDISSDSEPVSLDDNLVTLQASVSAAGRALNKLQLFSDQKLLETLDGDALEQPERITITKLFPAGGNRIWARLWYDENHSVDSQNALNFQTQDYSDGPWRFIRLGHKFPLGARYKDGVASFAGEGSCVGYQEMAGDFTLTAHIKDITLTTPENGVHGQNWLGLYASPVKPLDPNRGLESTFDEHGYGVYLTAGRGMKGWPDFEDLGGGRMCIPTFPSDHRWLRMVRRGDRLQSYTSADGKMWEKAMEVVSQNRPQEHYAGVWFRAIPGKGRSLFQGAVDHISLEPGAPAEQRAKVPAEEIDLTDRITAIVQAKANPDVLVARSPTLGVLKSADRGETFKPVNDGLTTADALAVRSVAVHPQNADIVLRGGGATVDGRLNSGLWRSEDGGQSWKLVTHEIDFCGDGPTTLFGEVIAFCPQDPNVVVAAGETKGAFLSRDAGLTWENVGLAGKRITCLGFNADTVNDVPLLVVGTSADNELHSLGMSSLASSVDSPGGVHAARIHNDKLNWNTWFELSDIAVTNLTFGAYENFVVIATSRGLYYTWQMGRTFSQRRHDVPADQLITALGYRQYPKRVGPGDIRTKSDTFATAFSQAGADFIRWVPERTALPWRKWAEKPQMEGHTSSAVLRVGVTCILPDQEDADTLFLCNRHGVFKTTDHGKTFRHVYGR